MGKRNNSRRRTNKKAELKKKTVPPIGMIIVGVGIILIGLAALFAMQGNNDTAANTGSAGEEYSSVPVPVEYNAPELSRTNLASGQEESLADYRGKIILVNLWATWCPPCKAELPVLQGYYENHADEGFVIIGIDFGEPEDTVASFIENARLTYPIWLDVEQKAGMAFNSYSLPASFVIDRDGVVRLAWTGQISNAMLEKHVTPLIQGN